MPVINQRAVQSRLLKWCYEYQTYGGFVVLTQDEQGEFQICRYKEGYPDKSLYVIHLDKIDWKNNPLRFYDIANDVREVKRRLLALEKSTVHRPELNKVEKFFEIQRR